MIATILIGLAVGIVAKLLMPGKDPGGFFITTLLGMGGAMVATYLGQFFNIYQIGHPAGFVGAVLGAILILFIYRRFKRA
ncbi:MAG: GlsB/YeaQ/YmgE family stress response membrane protein [bacterium]